ncbi:MAG TPA: hypothetical protein VMS17_08215 [Gemmataceae bacterium]|nr:hypothetical protein [Gemmataceae bacterium]
MTMLSFKFVDDALNQKLIALLKRERLKHRIDPKGAIHYSADDEEVVENDLICSIRDQVFSTWQIISCPSQWAGRYKQYMVQHGVPFVEELIDGQLCFLVPRRYRPHSWKLDDPSAEKKHRIA